jgi:hypothetical protein
MTAVPTNPVTTWRRALVTLLTEAFPEAEVLRGYRTGVSRDKDRIAVYWPRTPAHANPNYMRPQMTIRFWVKNPKLSARLEEVERDDAPLEQAQWDLATVLLPARASLPGLLGILYFEVRDISPNREDFSITALLDGQVQNQAAIPA